MKSGPIFSANPMEPIERMRERYACFQKCEDLLNRAESGKRKLTAAERAEYDAADARIAEITKYLEREGVIGPDGEMLHRGPGAAALVPDGGGGAGDGVLNLRNAETGEHIPSMALHEGARVRGFLREQMRGAMDVEPFALGGLIRGLATGRWDGFESVKERAAGVAPDVSGGFMAGESLFPQIMELAVGASIFGKTGIRLVLMPSETLLIARQVSRPSAGWVAENNTIPLATDPTFDAIRLRSKKLAIRYAISRELAEDASNAAEIIQQGLSLAMAEELDRVLAYGSGTGEEPLGVFNTPGIETDATAEALDYETFLDAIAAIEDNHGAAATLVMPPSMKNWLAKLRDGNQVFLAAPADYTALKRFVSSRLSTGQALLGDFGKIVLGTRSAMRVEISTQAGEHFEKDQIGIKLTWRGDVGVLQPEHLCAISNKTDPSAT